MKTQQDSFSNLGNTTNIETGEPLAGNQDDNEDKKVNKLETDLSSWHDSAIKQLSPKGNSNSRAKKNSLAVNSGMDIVSHS